MRSSIICLFMFLFIAAALRAEPDELQFFPGKNVFRGTIGSAPVHLWLSRTARTSVSGAYSYDKHPEASRRISGKVDDFQFVRFDLDAPRLDCEGNSGESFRVEKSGFDGFSGHWTRSDGKRTLPFHFEADQLEAPSGSYVSEKWFGWLQLHVRGKDAVFLLESNRGKPSYSSCSVDGHFEVKDFGGTFKDKFEQEDIEVTIHFDRDGSCAVVVKTSHDQTPFCGANTTFTNGRYLNVLSSAGKRRRADMDKELSE